jgi:hypothetical protein
MKRSSIAVEAIIDARPAAVYAALADYVRHHPRIMPASLFSRLRVEKGGVGAGTVFHITLRRFGLQRRLHMSVAEPEPGRTLIETNLATGDVTVFTVKQAETGSQTLTRISSEWQTAAGVRGLVDRFITPRLMRQILSRQLRQLGQYMRSIEAPV